MKKKKSEMSGLVLLLFSTLTLICGTTTSVKAQSSDNKKEIGVSKTIGKEDNMVIISQAAFDSQACSTLGSPTGMQAMFAFLKKNINYSSKAIEEKIEGDVTIDFTVTSKGAVANSRITKGLHPDIDKEVLGTVKRMPVLELSEKDGQKFDSDYKITMNFALPDGISLTKPTMSIKEVETENLKMTAMEEEKGKKEKSGTVIVSTASVTHTEPKNLEATTTECKSGSYIITTRDSSGIKKDAVPTKQVIIMTKDEYVK
ncbi:energy transducer TonB [Bacteroides congonensis]|jgi:TonB family protein|uniref:energy transducer TonB n=1 Tax=Bacteroides congonensis TaxID=1871006 RepID=UPI002430C312|nr:MULTISPECIES: energy transducer TonB [Bacteroides]